MAPLSYVPLIVTALARVAKTKRRTTILIFVSLPERNAHHRCRQDRCAPQAECRYESVVRGTAGSDGFAAVEIGGEVLATHFPSSGGDEYNVSDRMYLI